MTLNKPDFDSINHSDLTELIDGDVPESLYLEFKETTYGKNDEAKRELLKDVSAFANAHGGHIVIGMKENNGRPVELKGLDKSEVDSEIQRLEQIIRTGIEPSFSAHNFNLREIEINEKKSAIIIRIKQSWRLPHRVSAQGSNKFWLRNSANCHQASMEELRSLFVQSGNVLERAREFRRNRIKAINSESDPSPALESGRLIVHILPMSTFLSDYRLDVQDINNLVSEYFMPMRLNGGVSPRYNFEGLICEIPGVGNFGYTQIYRNGIIEATAAGLISNHNGRLDMPGFEVERSFFQKLGRYIDGLRRLGVETPLAVAITLDSVCNATYQVNANSSLLPGPPRPFDRDTLLLPECLITEYGEQADYHRAVKPAFDALWNAAGLPESQFFDKSGMWNGGRPS